jgi:hypothetical protein
MTAGSLIWKAWGSLEEIPALHPVVGALEFIGRDRTRLDWVFAERLTPHL